MINSIILELTILLIILMDPFGNMVVVNTLLSDYDFNKRRKIILRESIFALLLLMFVAWIGDQILELLGLKESSLRIAGGIFLFIISIKMVFPNSTHFIEKSTDPFIVPIAIPLIAGPSTLSVVILFSHEHKTIYVMSAILLACVVGSLILLFSPTIFKLLGNRGSRAIERLMGMLLIMISVQMILDGLSEYIKKLF